MTNAARNVAPGTTVRILVVDDHAMIREGVRHLLSGHLWLEICGEAENGREAVKKVQELKPDIVVLDISMPVMNGVEADREFHQISPGTKILILTLHDATQAAAMTRNVRVDAVVEKVQVANDLTKTLERLVENQFRS